MLNLNLNIIGSGDFFGSGSARSRGSNFLALWNWDFDERTVGIDAPNMDAIAHASFSLNAQNSNAIGISDDAGSQFQSIEDLPVTASLSGSGQWPVTGSCTMSLYIAAPGGDPDTEPFYFTGAVSCSAAEGNISTTSGSIIVCETTSSKNFIYFVSASIIHHKGNEYNPLVKVLATGSNSIYSNSQGSNTTLNIIKDENVIVSASIGNITGSQTTEFQYDYAFNITSSLTSSANWPRSQSHIYPTSSLIIPEVGISVTTYSTSSIITASFAADTNTTYTITASVAPRYIPAFSASFSAIAGGAGGGAGDGVSPGAGGGSGAAYTASLNILPNKLYNVVIGNSGSAGQNGQSTELTIWDSGFIYEIPITVSLQGGLTPTNVNGGNQGTGSFIVNGSPSNLVTFLGGTGLGPQNIGGTLYTGTGGGAGVRANGENGIITPPANSGDGGLGSEESGLFAALGGGGGGGADKRNNINSSRGIGGIPYGGAGGGTDTNQQGFPATGYGAGGGGGTSTNTGGPMLGGAGSRGTLIIRYYGSGSKLTTTNATTTYVPEGNYTEHIFNVGTGSFIYNFEPQLFG
jgi:hypothetical protein